MPVRTGSHTRADRFSVAILRLAVLVAIVTVTGATALRAADLHGTVVDPDGRPVAHARADIVGPLGAAASATTGADGRFDINGVPPGSYVLHVAADGLAADPRPIDLLEAWPSELQVTTRLAARTETLVVSAAQVEVPLSQASGSVTVLSGRDLQARQITAVGDALRLVAGMSVAQSGGHGALTSVFTRGGESDYTLVMVDGMRTNAFGGGLDLTQVPLIGVDRIEVVRGPQSALFGSDAIGGVVHVITRHGDRVRSDASVEDGSFATRRFDAAASGSVRGWSWHVGAQRFTSGGFTGLAADNTRVGNDDVRRHHVAGGLGWRAAAGAEVRGAALASSNERGYPGPYGSNPIGSYTGVDRISRGHDDRREAGVRALVPWFGESGRVRQRIDLTWADFASRFTSPYGPSASGTRRLTGRVQADAALSASMGLSAGIEWLGERATSTYITGERFQPIPVTRQVLGTFAEWRWSASARTSVAAGARIERIARDRLESSPDPYTPRPVLGDSTIVSMNPKISASWLAAGGVAGRAWTRVHASAGTGIRPPGAFEIAFTDNPDLQPERSRSVEAGVEQALAGGALLLDATLFSNTYDDLVVAVARSLQDASRFLTDNISNARARGLELSVGWRVARGLDVRTAYTRLDSAILAVDRLDQAPPPFRVGEALVRRPRHQFSIDAVLTQPRWTAFARAGGRGRALDIDPSWGAFGGRFEAPGYAVVGAGASVRLARGVEATVRAENLLNRSYEEVFGFPAPGRAVIVGARVAAGH